VRPNHSFAVRGGTLNAGSTHHSLEVILRVNSRSRGSQEPNTPIHGGNHFTVHQTSNWCCTCCTAYKAAAGLIQMMLMKHDLLKILGMRRRHALKIKVRCVEIIDTPQSLVAVVRNVMLLELLLRLVESVFLWATSSTYSIVLLHLLLWTRLVIKSPRPASYWGGRLSSKSYGRLFRWRLRSLHSIGYISWATSSCNRRWVSLVNINSALLWCIPGLLMRWEGVWSGRLPCLWDLLLLWATSLFLGWWLLLLLGVHSFPQLRLIPSECWFLDGIAVIFGEQDDCWCQGIVFRVLLVIRVRETSVGRQRWACSLVQALLLISSGTRLEGRSHVVLNRGRKASHNDVIRNLIWHV